MATFTSILTPWPYCTRQIPKLCFTSSGPTTLRCTAALAPQLFDHQSTNLMINVRRSGNYGPPIWDFDYIQSLGNGYAEEKYVRRANELKAQVKMMLQEEQHMNYDELNYLELVDDLIRLGLAYHFEDQIVRILSRLHIAKYAINHNHNKSQDLSTSALEFRLLRQHGFSVSQDVFDRFRHENGEFKQSLCEDTKGLLRLYEASFHSTGGETTLDAAKEFAAKHLNGKLENGNIIDEDLALLVNRALELPLHWRVPRIEARWYIDAYEKSQGTNLILLELAKLDYNIVQASHQKDLQSLSRWWKNIGLAENLTFVRDRVVENFIWALGIIFEPEYVDCRRMLGKLLLLLTSLDDVYDIYGTVEELELFTDAIERWDVKAMDQLPDYLKVEYLAIFNSVNEMAYDVLIGKGAHIVQHLRKAWLGVCKAYLQEAKWYHNGHTPTLEEYINNAWISISVPVMLKHVYAVIANPIQMDVLESVDSHNIVRWSSTLLRLADDLGTSSDEIARGDSPKSIQCYMKESGCSEEEAREHVWFLLRETWENMNKDSASNPPFDQTFVGGAKNFGRVALFMYLNGDGLGLNSNPVAKNGIMAALFDHVPLP